MKAKHGGGRKRSGWVEALQDDLISEFDQMRRMGVKFSISTLKELGYHLLSTRTNDAYSMKMLDPRTEKPLHTKIYYRWIQSFMERFRIVSRARTGKHGYSPAKQLEIEMSVAVHLGTVSGLFSAGYMDCLLYTSPSPRDQRGSRMPSSA